MHYWDNAYGTGWIGGLLMLISMILLWGGLITVVVVLIRRFAHPQRPHDDAVRILNERFARGEIDEDEYQRRRAALTR